jgi:alanine racemase
VTGDAHRSVITVDLTAFRTNLRRCRDVAGAADLWAVVKANAYGHGASVVGGIALEEGAAALCTATAAEAAELRAVYPEARLIVLGPSTEADLGLARQARLEITSVDGRVPEGIPVHLKLDTGMGRWGTASLGETPRNVVGVMSHFATADSDLAFAGTQLERFLALTAARPDLPRSIANSAGALRLPAARLDACRFGIALYGASPFGTDPTADGLAPVLRWTSHIAQSKRLGPGESTGYGRQFVAGAPSWIGLVPVGYADGFRRGLTGTDVVVAGARRRVIGTISMDCFAVALAEELPVGTPVSIVGDGVLVEEHAARLGTIAYEILTGLSAAADRCIRVVSGS